MLSTIQKIEDSFSIQIVCGNVKPKTLLRWMLVSSRFYLHVVPAVL